MGGRVLHGHACPGSSPLSPSPGISAHSPVTPSTVSAQLISTFPFPSYLPTTTTHAMAEQQSGPPTTAGMVNDHANTALPQGDDVQAHPAMLNTELRAATRQTSGSEAHPTISAALPPRHPHVPVTRHSARATSTSSPTTPAPQILRHVQQLLPDLQFKPLTSPCNVSSTVRHLVFRMVKLV